MENLVINIYTKEGCPKCKVLQEICKNSKFIAENDFQICDVEKDPVYLDLLKENNITSLPVLLVDNDFYNFNEAITYIRTMDGEKS